MKELNLKQIIKHLELHNIDYYVENGHIFCDRKTKYSLLWDHIIDVTGYTLNDLKAALNF